MDDITELLGRLDTATDDELAAARTQVLGALDDLRPAVEAGTVTDAELAQIEALGEQHRQLTEAQTSRTDAAAERTAAAANILAGVTPDSDEADGDAALDGDEGSSEGDGDAEGDAAADDTAGDVAQVDEQQPEPVAAGASRPALGQIGRRNGARRPAATARIARPVAITAAADISGFAAGQTLTGEDLGRAFAARLQSVSRVRGGDGELVHVATMTANGPKERKLRKDVDNTSIIEAATSPQALIAAGGLCAPFTPDYSIEVDGDISRPVRDALAGFQAERGGIYFRPDIDGAATAPDASGVWTNDNDAAVGSGTEPDPKPYATVDCPDMVQAQVEAETFQVEFSNVTAKFDPESTAASLKALEIAHARWSENRLIAKLNAGSTLVQYDHKLGAVRDYLAMIDQILAYYRSLHRLAQSVPLRMILPAWLLNMFRVDILRALHNSNDEYFSYPDTKIMKWFADRGVNVTFHLDGKPTATAAAAPAPAIAAQQYAAKLAAGDHIPGFPDQVDALLFREGKWLHLDGGTLDLGIVRDSTLIEKNRYRLFSEEWIGAVHRGIESLRVVATVQPTGGSAGTVDTSAFND